MKMTEKIIIDGVDVSGCKQYEHLLKDRSFLDCDCKRIMTCNGASAICKGYNCYFKQLARKTEECERMKKALNEIRDYELERLDVEWDEYEVERSRIEYNSIIDHVEVGLGEIEDE